jgi:UDP-glucuronate 4-epimerase
MKVLITGNAGFIGYHATLALLRRGDSVVGFDVVNDYYDPKLKEARLAEIANVAEKSTGSYDFIRANLADRAAVEKCFVDHSFDRVINLAAQAGVRHSFKDPHAYVESNVSGFTNILEGCRHAKVAHLTYASTSSVYGANRKMPFSERHGVDHPLQIYAATKKLNELMSHAYSHLFGLPTTGLRFFSVYGPWGRPDMALFLFTKNILAGEPIQLFNRGEHIRDFTYVEDIVEGVIRASDKVAAPNPLWDAMNPDPQSSDAPYRILNIGGGNPVNLWDYVAAIEEATGKKAKVELLPLQPGDVPDNIADATELEKTTGFRPTTPVREGVKKFVDWYRRYYNIC